MKAISLALALFLAGHCRAESSTPPVPHELTLQKCVELALAHNPDLRAASEQFLAADGRVLKLQAILYPTLNAQGLSTPLTFFVQIQQTFYSRAIMPQVRLSRLTREQAVLNYRQTLIDVIFQVRQAFTTELGAQRLATLSRQLIDDREAAVKTARQLFDAGKAQRSDILPLQVLAGLARQNQSLAVLTQQQSTIALRTLLGIDLPETVTFQGDFEQDRGPADLDAGKLAAQALRDREDLKLLENTRLEALQQIQIDTSSAYPSVGFESDSAIQPPAFLPGGNGYDLERNDDEPQTERQAGNTQLPLSLYMNWTIFDGGAVAGARASDRAQIASQEEAIDELKKSIPGEVAAAVAAILDERATLRLLHAQGSSEEERQVADTDYQAGRVRLLDKINLETDIVRQQQLRLNSQIRLSLALAALDHALGRGLVAPPGSASP